MIDVMKPTPTRSDAAPAQLHLIRAEPTPARWSRRRTLLFILGSCAALWAMILLGYRLIF